MLVLSRKLGERIHIGSNIIVTVVAVDGQRIRLGIEAPKDISIRREELADKPLVVAARLHNPKEQSHAFGHPQPGS